MQDGKELLTFCLNKSSLNLELSTPRIYWKKKTSNNTVRDAAQGHVVKEGFLELENFNECIIDVLNETKETVRKCSSNLLR